MNINKLVFIILILLNFNIFCSQDLFDAIEDNDLVKIEQLLNKSVNINEQRKKDYCSPLHFAVICNNLKIAELLISKGAYINSWNKNRETPLYTACAMAKIDMIKLLLNNKAEINKRMSLSGWTPLMIAIIKKKCLKCVKLLVEKGADVNFSDNLNASPLFWAAYSKSPEIVQFLISKNVNVNQITTYSNETALYVATEKENIKIVELLLKNGAKTHKANCYGYTPLHYLAGLSIAATEIQLEIAKLLLRQNSYINKTDIHGDTAYDLAIKNNKIKLANIIKAKLGQIDLICNFIINAITKNNVDKAINLIKQNLRIALEYRDKKGENFLHLAICRCNQEDMIKSILCLLYSLITEKNNDGDNVIAVAVKSKPELARNIFLLFVPEAIVEN